MTKQSFKYSKYFWDLNETALKETASILNDPGDSKFQSRAIRILSRCQDPKELFSIISKKNFIKAWPKLRKRWAKIDKESDFRDWWQTIYEEVLGRQSKRKKIIGTPALLFKDIGLKIKEARIAKDMSQEDLALTVGMKQPDISKIEEGKKNITLETLARICRCLDIKEIGLEG
jgi:DNA-binding Xre family transcriptional regulator